MPIRTIILGAAGRDFHNFNTVFRNSPEHDIVAFTAQQIPHIENRRYPAVLAGARYPDGIPIYEEERLEELIASLGATLCVMSYSDVAHVDVMHLASRANAAGADFSLLSATHTMLPASRPVVAVTASRTGAGKSQTSRAIARLLREAGLRVVVVRHPMPYGDLARQRVQVFVTRDDLVRHQVTIEEREEYEPHLATGSVVLAGVDYGDILREAESRADVILWDGGNNDTPFFRPDVHIVVVDPHRVGHETLYYPGETNLRMAGVVLINKIDTADAASLTQLRANIAKVNPRATVLEAASPPRADDPEVLRGRRVLAIEDGPTVTHGGMRYGAATIAASALGATLVDPRPFLRGELVQTFAEYPHTGALLPAMGYGEQQVRDLEATIAAAAAGGVEAVAIGTPIDLAKLVSIAVPYTRVRYDLEIVGGVHLRDVLKPVLH
ncbi:MAG: GTP-binding protein [Gemmatimonadaceae bacterium]